MDGRGKRTVNANDVYERTPLHLAAQEGHDELVEFFLKRGAKIDRSGIIALITFLYFVPLNLDVERSALFTFRVLF